MHFTTPIPILLVTGFLGSGKTTLLLHWARAGNDAGTAFLVNEFSSAGVDPQRLRAESGQTVYSVLGGSIFCECRAGKFLETLRELRSLAETGNLRQLVVETSGMASPAAVQEMLRGAGLEKNFFVRDVFCVVSAPQAHKLIRTLPAFTEQIAAANLLLLNKTDLATAEEIDEARRLLREYNSDCPVVECRYSDLTAPPPNLASPPTPSAELAKTPNPYSVVEKRLVSGVEPAEFAACLEREGNPALRVKGFLAGRDGNARYFDWTPEGWSVVELPGTPHPVIVFIYPDPEEPAMQQFFDREKHLLEGNAAAFPP
ncbi:MAG: hypothetical protein GVY10_04625 [Verrucomicrobia bacterium]|jgi:G3E family GTPase|nr:hypothetical protein [Verrucomicrobiota bacterium]